MTHSTHTLGCSCIVELQLLPARQTCSTLHIGEVHFGLRLASTSSSLGNHPDGRRARSSHNLEVLPADTSRFRRPTCQCGCVICASCACARCAHGNLLRSTHERARMRCMGGLTAAHLRLAALSCSRCEQLPKTLLADAARERRAPAFLARVARFGRVNSSIHTRGRPL